MSGGRPPRPRFTRRTSTRVAFTVITVFVVAQAVWWVVFQRGYIADVSDMVLSEWDADAVSAQAAWDASGGDASVRDELLALHPQLRLEDGAFVVDERVRDAFLAEQRGHLRMFAWEGPFFVVVILSMLWLIGRSLREERALKRSHQNFLSAVTHEFKTPVATLRLLVETAQLRDLDAGKRRDYLARMAGEVDRLERTSEQVLAAARLEQGPLPARMEPRDLRDAVAQRLAALRPGLEARGARLRLEAGEEPLPVSLDEDAFALVLGNLLDNAVKYTPEGRREVTVRLEARGDVIEMHVDDRGIGVEESERERIFERFHRSGDESTRRAPGTGLGLHLVRGTVEAMNGWVRVAPNPEGVGSRFTVTLPRRVAAGGRDAAGGDAPAGEAAS
jgi:signal transduction histidine kinase